MFGHLSKILYLIAELKFLCKFASFWFFKESAYCKSGYLHMEENTSYTVSLYIKPHKIPPRIW